MNWGKCPHIQALCCEGGLGDRAFKEGCWAGGEGGLAGQGSPAPHTKSQVKTMLGVGQSTPPQPTLQD